MKVVELREIRRRETHLHYIREFTAVAVLESNAAKCVKNVSFTVEHKALGPPDINVRVLDSVDWPLLPVVRAIRTHLYDLERKGNLS
jgi:hypothetical protein